MRFTVALANSEGQGFLVPRYVPVLGHLYLFRPAGVVIEQSGYSFALSSVLAVVEDDDVGVIGVDDDALRRTPRSTVASGAFVISVTGSSSR